MRDLSTEDYLKRGGYQFEFRQNVPIAHIDLVEAKNNSARPFRPLDEETALKYGLAMQEGTDFPGIVVIKRPSHKLLLLGTGLHRIEGAMHFCKPVKAALDAYVVSEDNDYRIHILVHGLNSIMGKAPSPKENLLLAAELKRLYPQSAIKDIVAAFPGMRESSLDLFLRQQKGERRADELGILDSFASIKSQNLKIHLDRIQNNNLFVRTTKFVVDWKLVGSEAEAFIVEVQKARTENGGSAVIDSWENNLKAKEQRAKAKFGRPGRTSMQILTSRLKMILRGPDVHTLRASMVDDRDVKDTMLVFEDTIERLSTVLRILKAKWDNMTKQKASADSD